MPPSCSPAMERERERVERNPAETVWVQLHLWKELHFQTDSCDWSDRILCRRRSAWERTSWKKIPVKVDFLNMVVKLFEEEEKVCSSIFLHVSMNFWAGWLNRPNRDGDQSCWCCSSCNDNPGCRPLTGGLLLWATFFRFSLCCSKSHQFVFVFVKYAI